MKLLTIILLALMLAPMKLEAQTELGLHHVQFVGVVDQWGDTWRWKLGYYGVIYNTDTLNVLYTEPELYIETRAGVKATYLGRLFTDSSMDSVLDYIEPRQSAYFTVWSDWIIADDLNNVRTYIKFVEPWFE